MSDTTFKDLLAQINNDLEEIEAVQETVGKLTSSTKNLEEEVKVIISEAEVRTKELKKMLQKNQALLKSLEGLKLPSVKAEMLSGLEEFKDGFFLKQQTIHKAIAGLLKDVEAALDGISGSIQQVSGLVETQKRELSKEISQVKGELSKELSDAKISNEQSFDQLTAQNNRIEKAQKHNRKLIVGFGIGLLIAIIACLVMLFLQKPTLSKAESSVSNPELTENNVRPASKEQKEIPKEKDQDLNEPAEETLQDFQPPNVPPEDILPPEEAESIIATRAGYTLTYIKWKTFDRMAQKYFHPDQGVHFYPNGIRSGGLRLDNGFMASAMSQTGILNWGVINEESIQMSFPQYYDQYIFDKDFSESENLHYNQISLPGESGLHENEIFAKYPKCAFVEHVLDGESLILVFVELAGKGWYLTAVVHNE